MPGNVPAAAGSRAARHGTLGWVLLHAVVVGAVVGVLPGLGSVVLWGVVGVLV